MLGVGGLGRGGVREERTKQLETKKKAAETCATKWAKSQVCTAKKERDVQVDRTSSKGAAEKSTN